MPKAFSVGDRLKSFVFAFNGIKNAVLTQHNLLIHIVLAIIALLLGFLLKISMVEWISIIIVIGMVMAAEIFNSSIEELVNLISPVKNDKARIIKDMSAGAVLIVAVAAFITGVIIFLPKILRLL
ncbi:MAG: diacylglycerol kinase family protein [Bacteroidetes bacterium]|nr:diacylglycerol kinase family protein [Bacteroidota bacterium]MBL6944062.1 diacylglycerol kinase family protein [Bacteroidales bacterium]